MGRVWCMSIIPATQEEKQEGCQLRANPSQISETLSQKQNGLFYSPSLMCDFPLVWPVFHNIAEFVLGLYSTYERKHVAFGLLNLATST
jgi:hypothetical protein